MSHAPCLKDGWMKEVCLRKGVWNQLDIVLEPEIHLRLDDTVRPSDMSSPRNLMEQSR